MVYRKSAFRFSVPPLSPRRRPFDTEPWYCSGRALNFTLRGVCPTFDFTMTAPEVRSPYSADGMPRITSTDSTLSKEMVLVSIPAALFPAFIS